MCEFVSVQGLGAKAKEAGRGTTLKLNYSTMRLTPHSFTG